MSGPTTTVPIGHLNRRLEIDAPIATHDGSFAWTPLATVWGNASQGGASERDTDGRIVGLVRWQFVIRWRGDVDSTCRIRWDGRIFRLTATSDPTSDRRYLMIEAEEELR